MGQNTSQPERPSTILRTSHFTAYDPSSEYSEESFLTTHNIPVIESIPVESIPPTYKYQNIIQHQSLSTTDSSSASTSGTTSTHQPTHQLVQEARQQYNSGRGLFYSVATLKLRRFFLHPVDLTESEFVSLVCAEDNDAWIASYRPKLTHRMITRQGQAQRELKEAGIASRDLEGIEMFELMNAEERQRFIEEHKTQQQKIEDNLRDAMREEIVPGPSRRKSESIDMDEAIQMQELERARSMETRLSQWSLEGNNTPLRRRRSVFESLGGVFRNHRHRESTGSSEASYTGPETMRPGRKRRRLSNSVHRSVNSIRHVFGHKHKAFKRAGIGEVAFVH